MKVLLINGSPNEFGCTYTALSEVERVLNRNDIETEILYLGKGPVPGCIACRKCSKTGRCTWDDKVNEIVEKIDEIHGMVIGSPVYYAGANGSLTSFLDRLFYTAGSRMVKKPGAAVVSCRRGGASAAFDRLNKYFSISSMPIVSSNYWNQVHGSVPEEVLRDEEGMQTMRILGENMAWMLRCIEAGEKSGVKQPEYESKILTNFIR